MMKRCVFLVALLVLLELPEARRHHHHHHRKSAEKKRLEAIDTEEDPQRERTKIVLPNEAPTTTTEAPETTEAPTEAPTTTTAVPMKRGRLVLNGPIPANFEEIFQGAVAQALGCDPSKIHIISTSPVDEGASFLQVSATQGASMGSQLFEVIFEGPEAVVDKILTQASDLNSPIVSGPLHNYLVAQDEVSVVRDTPVDVDGAVPFGQLEAFGREDTAAEQTEASVQESDGMVDQLERAEVAEEKRAVFRALTRLRGAAITSFDGIARSQTANVDEYNRLHHWRSTHPLHHLADEEADYSKWAFPNSRA